MTIVAACALASCSAPLHPIRAHMGPLDRLVLEDQATTASLCFGRGDEREEVPDTLDQTLLHDELVLVSVSPMPCVQFTLHTSAENDQSLYELEPACVVDDRPVEGDVREEHMRPASFWYDYYPPGSFEPVERALHVVTRHGVVCCPGEGEASRNVSLTLTNRLMGTSDERPWTAKASWQFSP